MKKNVHVVPHSHWDREWYFTTSRSKVYLMHDVQAVLNQLEQENGYHHFILDGQASLLDDYLAWRPQDEARVRKLVQAGKLIVGPWYTQTDQLVISGESIVRNMLYGMRISQKFGNYLNVGYVPDSFGQAASMPQIYQEFGIEDTLFWRGVSDDEVEHTEYTWRGEDGSVVNVFQIPCGYYIGGNIPEEETALQELMTTEPFRTIVERASTNQIYFPNGFDQAPVRTNLPVLVERMNALYDDFEFTISDIETYIQAVKDEQPNLKEISGELMNGKLMRIHKSIFSSRADLKQLNTEIQFYLVNVMEPLLTISELYGFDYPQKTVETIWKLMFENAAHDSIGSCVSDTTNEDVYMRYKQARDISVNLVELTLREMSTRIERNEATPITLTLWNPLPEERTGVIETELYIPGKDFQLVDAEGQDVPYTLLTCEDQTDYVLAQTIKLDPSRSFYMPTTVYAATIAIEVPDGIPSMGYTQIGLIPNEGSEQALQTNAETVVANEFYHIQVNEKGSLDIYDVAGERWYRNQAILVENGDDGDSFNYSPPREDWVQTSEAQPYRVTMEQSQLYQKVTVVYDFQVPATLEQRAAKQATLTVPVTLEVVLKKGQPTIECRVSLINQGDSHRFSIDFATGIASQFSIADQQFGTLRRPVERTEALALWEANQAAWNEKPIAIETCQSFVALSDETATVAVYPKGVREYEIVGKAFDTIRLTLFRTFGFMGKENLLYRPGRASGEKVIATPAAQLHKPLAFEFGISYTAETFEHSSIGQQAKRFTSPVQVYQYAEFLNGRLLFSLEEEEQPDWPLKESLWETDTQMVLSVVKKAETRPGTILRYYNSGFAPQDLTLTFQQAVSKAEWVNLKEETKAPIALMNNQIQLKGIEHAKFVTLYLEFA